MGDGVRMDAETAAQVENRFDNLAQELWEMKSVVDRCEDTALAGAGDLSGELADGVTRFCAGWRAAFDVTSTSAALVAGNTNELHVDLEALDRDASHALDLDITI